MPTTCAGDCRGVLLCRGHLHAVMHLLFTQLYGYAEDPRVPVRN